MIKNIKLWKLVDYLIWSLPLAAMTLSVYLVIDYYASRDLDVHIVFSDASSVEPQKTQLIYKGIVVGVVEGVRLDAKNHNVIVRASLDREAKDLAVEGTRFKIIQPKVGFSGISGLETLLKGSYIKIEKGTGGQKKTKGFVGVTSNEEELQDVQVYILRAKNGKGLSAGMPIEHKGLKIGSVVSVDFEALSADALEQDQDQDILVKIGIENKFAKIINQQSRFWRRPAVNARFDVSGFNFEIASLEALLKGSILVEGFDKSAEPVSPGHQFVLHEKFPAKRHIQTEPKVFQLLTNDAESLHPNDPIYYRGIKTGVVSDVTLKNDGRAVVHLAINHKYKHLVKANTVFWRKSAVDTKLGWSGLSLRVSSLESLMRGGVNFATPTELGADVPAGFSFVLNDKEPDDNWKKWNPRFPTPVKNSVKNTNLSFLQ